MSTLYSNSIFWVEVEKINPNPYQPRKEFDEHALRDLADSIRQYGVLQPLVVTRKEIEKEDGGLFVQYELIAGERRLRASKLAGLAQVPVIIRQDEDPNVKLELAIIENLQREDLNAIDRARAFLQLAQEFSLTHAEIGRKMGKSREYVSNSLRLLQLPQDIMQAVAEKKISEGHTRPLMMLSDRPEEQMTLFKEIMFKKMSVRESELVARKIAKDRARKKDYYDPRITEFEEKFSENLGTRVHIEASENGGKIVIDYFDPEDLQQIYELVKTNKAANPNAMLARHEERVATMAPDSSAVGEQATPTTLVVDTPELPAAPASDPMTMPVVDTLEITSPVHTAAGMTTVFQQALPQAASIMTADDQLVFMEDQTIEDEKRMDEEVDDLYNIGNFTV